MGQKRKRSLSFEDFSMSEEEWDEVEDHNPEQLVSKSRRIPAIRALANATDQNCPAAFQIFLNLFLAQCDLHAPDRVFCKPTYLNPGRPADPKSRRLYQLWVSLSKPSLYSNKLAKAYYG